MSVDQVPGRAGTALVVDDVPFIRKRLSERSSGLDGGLFSKRER